MKKHSILLSIPLLAMSLSLASCGGKVPASVTVRNPSSDLTLEVGKTLQLDVEVLPSDANQDVVYTIVSGNDVVSLTDAGLVTAVKVGTAVIDVASKAKATIKDSVTIQVIEANPLAGEWQEAIKGVEEELKIVIGDLPIYANDAITGYSHEDVYGDGTYCIVLEGHTFAVGENDEYPIEIDANAQAYAASLKAVGFTEGEDSFGDYALISKDGTYGLGMFNFYVTEDEGETYTLGGSAIAFFAEESTGGGGGDIEEMWTQAVADLSAAIGIDVKWLPTIVADEDLVEVFYDAELKAIAMDYLSTTTYASIWLDTLVEDHDFEEGANASGTAAWFAPEDAYCITYDYDSSYDYFFFEVPGVRYVPVTDEELLVSWNAALAAASTALEADFSALPMIRNTYTTGYSYDAEMGLINIEGVSYIEDAEADAWHQSLVALNYELASVSATAQAYFAPEDAYAVTYYYESYIDWELFEIVEIEGILLYAAPTRWTPPTAEELTTMWNESISAVETALSITIDIPQYIHESIYGYEAFDGYGDGVTYCVSLDGFSSVENEVYDQARQAYIASLLAANFVEMTLTGTDEDGESYEYPVYASPDGGYGINIFYDSYSDLAYLYVEVLGK